jgi:lysophospholipase L1-like esterase
MLAGRLAAARPGLEPELLNRGISGNRVADLRGRWKVDCLELKPDILSILIGINNVWRAFDSADPTSDEQFYEDYKLLLDDAREAGIEHIVLLEPFALPVPPDRLDWRDELSRKIALCRELATAYRTYYVPLNGLFYAAAARSGPAYWAADGVHPSPAGHGLIAEAWIHHTGLRL